MDQRLEAVLIELERTGGEHDAREPEHAKKLLNLERPTAELISILLRTSGAGRVLEIGTSNGYSTLWIAWSIRPLGGHLVSLERLAYKQDQARKNLVRAGLDDSVELLCGDATELVRTLNGEFDAIFFDADRWSASEQLEILKPHLSPKCLLLADNALSHPQEIASYLAMLETLPGFESTIVPVGKGLSVAYRAGLG